MSELRLCAVSVDLDEVPCYAAIHGIDTHAASAHAIYEKAVPRLQRFFAREKVAATFFAVGQDLTHAPNAEALRPYDVAWIEEPIVYDNLDGYARLAADLKTPLQIGENFYGPREMYKALQRKACDLVMPDFMRIGGVTGWMRAAAIAGAAGIPMSTHLYPEVAAHVMRVTETAHWLEWQDWADPILQQPYAVKDGQLHIPDVPGVGIEWNEDVVAAHLA